LIKDRGPYITFNFLFWVIRCRTHQSHSLTVSSLVTLKCTLVLVATSISVCYITQLSDSMASKNGRNYFQLSFDFYDRSGLRRSSTFLQKCVSLYILYPLLLILHFMVIFNFRYKHNDIFDFAEVFTSISAFGNVQGLITTSFIYSCTFNFSYSSGKHFS
jgi:hypothetical protein